MVGGLLSSVRALVLLLWDACQLCIASAVATLLTLLRLSETLRLARLSAALTESSKAPAKPTSAALALSCSGSSSALHKLLLPPRLGTRHRLTVRGFVVGRICHIFTNLPEFSLVLASSQCLRTLFTSHSVSCTACLACGPRLLCWNAAQYF